MVKYLAKGYLWALLLLLYSPILIIMIFSFTEAKVLGNWTGFSTKLYSSPFCRQRAALVGKRPLEYVRYRHDSRYGIYLVGKRGRYRDL